MVDHLKKPLYQRVNGVLFPKSFPIKHIQEAFDYKPRADDVFIVTYPKNGTTWMQSIALHIFRQGKELESEEHFWTMSPFLDMKGEEGVRKMERPGPIKTHLPYNHMPYSPDAKYIFVVRNPWDVCVSLYYHTINIPHGGYTDGKFDDFYELFMAAEVEYNDYFDHLLSWYPHRNDKNLFYMTYEDIKKDRRDAILKVAEFLGKEYIDAIHQDNKLFNDIMKFSSFEYMKTLFSDEHRTEKNCDHPKMESNGIDGISKPTTKSRKRDHIRKGIVGDWKNHFNEDQVERLRNRFYERTKGTDISDLWPNMQNEFTKDALV